MTAGAGAEPSRPSGAPTAATRRMEQALRLYRRRVARCGTENQLNRLHIAVENYMTPAELRHFLAGLAADAADSPSRRWIARLAALMPVNATRPLEFERRGLVRGATRYTAGDGIASGKTLIIGFTGHFHRLMMPMPWLLDCLNPDAYDLVVLRDFPRVNYSLGIPGLGADFFCALAELARRIDPRAYRNTIALGTSGGGMPALLAAIFLELDKGIAISPQDFTRFAAKLSAIGLASDRHAALLASRPDRFPGVVVAYPADSPGDTAAALALAAQLPVDLRPAKRCANHAVLAWQHQRGTLPTYLSKLLGQSLESAAPLAAPLVTAFMAGAGPGSALRVVAGGSAGASAIESSGSR
jgi:hypothetical protein